MTPARLIVSPGGSELLTTSYQTYGLPGDVQPDPSSDSISSSYSAPTYAVGQRSSSSSPGVSWHGPPSMSKSAAVAPLANAATQTPTQASASLKRPGEPRLNAWASAR